MVFGPDLVAAMDQVTHRKELNLQICGNAFLQDKSDMASEVEF
jgi:hypothetical protein